MYPFGKDDIIYAYENGLKYKFKFMDFSQEINKKYFIATILVFAVVVAIAYAFKSGEKISQSPDQLSGITVENTKIMLDRQSSLKFSGTSSNLSITLSEWPERLTFLLLPNAQNTKLQKLQYRGGETGYTIGYTVKSELQAVHFALIQSAINSGWRVTASTRALLATIIELEKNKVKIKIISSKDAEDYIGIYAQSIETNN